MKTARKRIGWLLILTLLATLVTIPAATAYAAISPRMEVTYENDAGQTITPENEGEIFWMTMKNYGIETMAGTTIKITFDKEAVQIVNSSGASPANMNVASKNLCSHATDGIIYKDPDVTGHDGAAFDSTGPIADNANGLFKFSFGTIITDGTAYYEYPLTETQKTEGLLLGQVRFKVLDATKTPNFQFHYLADVNDGGYYQDTVQHTGEDFYKSADEYPVSFAPVGFGPQAPKAPTVKAEVTGKDKIAVSWTANGAEADYYEVTGNGTTTTQAGLSKEFTGLKLGTEYSFSVKGHNQMGYGLAGTAKATTWNVPGKPAITSVAQGALTLTVKWTKPAVNGSELTGYTLEYSKNENMSGSSKLQVGKDQTSATIEGLEKDATYYLRLTATNGAGNSDPSDVVSKQAIALISAGLPVFTTPPAATTAAYGNTATLTAGVTLESRPTTGTLSYQWYRNETDKNTSGTAISGAVQASYTLPKQDAGEDYYYCEVVNTDQLADVETDLRGETVAKAVSDAVKVTIEKAPLKADGFTAKTAASIKVGATLDLDILMTMGTTAGAVDGETLVQVLDLANAKVSDSAIVKFQTEKIVTITQAGVNTSGEAIEVPVTTKKAVDVDYDEVTKTAGTYTYAITIPMATASTNYAPDKAIDLNGTLTVSKKSSGGGGGGGGSSSSTTTATGTDIKKELSSAGSATVGGSELKNAKSIEVKSSQITISLNQKAVNALDKAASLILKAEKRAEAALKDAAKELIGSRPVFDVTATQNGKAVTDFGSGRVTIAIGYTPVSGEDSNKLFLYYINEKGDTEKVSGSKYDATLKAVTGETNHLSAYAVGYDVNAADTTKPTAKGYTDISSSDWFYTAVMSLSDKGIVSGIPNEDAKGNPVGTYKFNPSRNVTRAEFASMLAKAAGADLSKYSTKVFDDVNANDWYAGAVAWANSTGVASGTGDGNFSPTANITRQDMAVMVSKYLTNVAKTTLTAKNEKLTFTDSAQIAEYAKTAVEGMQTAGVLSGLPNEDANGKAIGTYEFRPTANATRAEAAAMMNGLLGVL